MVPPISTVLCRGLERTDLFQWILVRGPEVKPDTLSINVQHSLQLLTGQTDSGSNAQNPRTVLQEEHTKVCDLQNIDYHSVLCLLQHLWENTLQWTKG